MAASITRAEVGNITIAKGFTAGGTYAGIKTYSEDKMDVGMLLSDAPCVAAGVFTRSSIVSPSVTVNRETLAGGHPVRGLVVNSGIANAGVGEQGYIDAKEMAALGAAAMGVKPEEVLICSTGIIGVELPMALIKQGIDQIELSKEGGAGLSRAMMTTDTHPKAVGLTLDLGGTEVHIGGVAKGSGMIHPNMATMLSFVATDAAVDQAYLRSLLPEVADSSMNMLTIDGDSSTNDSLLVFSNGAAGNAVITGGSAEAEDFKAGLVEVCVQLTRQLAADGEGATRLLVVEVEGARHIKDARDRRQDHRFLPAGQVGCLRRRPQLGPFAGSLGSQPSRGGGEPDRRVHQRRLHYASRPAHPLPPRRGGRFNARDRGDLPPQPEPW